MMVRAAWRVPLDGPCAGQANQSSPLPPTLVC